MNGTLKPVDNNRMEGTVMVRDFDVHDTRSYPKVLGHVTATEYRHATDVQVLIDKLYTAGIWAKNDYTGACSTDANGEHYHAHYVTVFGLSEADVDALIKARRGRRKAR